MLTINKSLERTKERCDALGIKLTPRTVVVSIAQQVLMFFEDCVLRQSYVVSTSRRPPSNVRDSLGTPRGLHQIAEKHGAGAPPGIVFKGRVSTGKHFGEFDAAPEKNFITTRILWLRGLEPGVNVGGNVDTYERYIYIHGTNHEEMLGTPFSAGCVHMHNVQIIDFFDAIRVVDLVWIED